MSPLGTDPLGTTPLGDSSSGSGPAPPTLSAQFSIEVEIVGVFVDITQDVLIPTEIHIQTGLSGGTPKDLVAPTGTGAFGMANGESNSAGLRGYYSPFNVNKRAGWGFGLRCRIRFYDPAVARWITRLVGKIDVIDPISGIHNERIAMVTIVDWMDVAAQWSLTTDVGEQVGKRSDEIYAAIVAAMPEQPEATNFDGGTSAYPWALTQAGVNQVALAAFGDVAASEQGSIYIAADGTLRGESRHTRLLHTTPDWVLTDADISEVEAPSARADIVNAVYVTVHPKVVDEAPTTVVYAMADPILVQAGETKTFQATYRDPVTGDAIGATDVQPQDIATYMDYSANSVQDGTGTDVTADFTIIVTAVASNAEFAVTNGGASSSYLRTNKLRGRAIKDHGTLTASALDAPSIAANGIRPLRIDMPFEASFEVGQAAADYYLAKYLTSIANARTVMVHGTTSDRLTHILATDVSSRLQIVETMTGVANDYFVNGITLTVDADRWVSATYVLTPATDPFGGNYFILGTSALDSAAVLIPF
ncbi:MAG: hypothetical protein V4529_17160 [Gemmatimonadota bacterium]